MGLPHIVRGKKYHLWRHIAELGTHSALASLRAKYENMVNRPADGFVVASIGAYALYVHVFMAIWKEHLMIILFLILRVNWSFRVNWCQSEKITFPLTSFEACCLLIYLFTRFSQRLT